MKYMYMCMYLRLCKFLCYFTLFEAIQHVELASQCYCLTDSVCLFAAVASSWTHIVTMHEPLFFCWVYPLHTNTIYKKCTIQLSVLLTKVSYCENKKYTTYSSCTVFEYTFVYTFGDSGVLLASVKSFPSLSSTTPGLFSSFTSTVSGRLPLLLRQCENTHERNTCTCTQCSVCACIYRCR